MVYIPRLTFKSGINPSLLAKFPMDGKYTGTQKLLLTRTRIFGDKISGNFPSGMKVWHQTSKARFQYLAKGSIQMHNLYRDIPDLNKVCPDDNMDNYLARKQHREQMKIQKQAKKAAKQAKKKK